MICVPIKDSGMRRTGYSNELYVLCDELDIVRKIKLGRLRFTPF